MTDFPNSRGPPLAPAGGPVDFSTQPGERRKKASTACQACRTRRTKCSPGVPCTSCIRYRTPCYKDENDDGRRRVAIKRKMEGLEDDRGLLDNLIITLKQDSDEEVHSLVNLIRQVTSHNDLRSILDKKSAQKANDNSNFGRRPLTGNIADLINPPIQVPAIPWTNVTDDNDVVSHLISLWFTWIHPWFRWVERDVFVEAMKSRNLESPFCTPYLVNYILAQLLELVDTERNSYYFRIRQKFLSEAKDGVEVLEGQMSLTMIQALGVRWTDLYLSGQDDSGRVHLNTQVMLAGKGRRLDQWRAKVQTNYQRAPAFLDQFERCLDVTLATLYSLNAFDLTDLLEFHSRIRSANTNLGRPHETAFPEMRVFYPQKSMSEPQFHPDCHFRSVLSLAQATVQNEELSAKRNRGEEVVSDLEKLQQFSKHWPSSLPPCMEMHAQAIPHVLMLHGLYHWLNLVIAKQAKSAEEGQASRPTIIQLPTTPESQKWQNFATSSAIAIARIARQYAQVWGTEQFPPIVLQLVSLALPTLLADLDSQDNIEAFIYLSKALEAVSRKFRAGRAIITTMRNSARDHRVVLPGEVNQIYNGPRGSQSSTEVMDTGETQGTDIVSSPEDDRDSSVDHLIGKWEDL